MCIVNILFELVLLCRSVFTRVVPTTLCLLNIIAVETITTLFFNIINIFSIEIEGP